MRMERGVLMRKAAYLLLACGLPALMVALIVRERSASSPDEGLLPEEVRLSQWRSKRFVAIDRSPAFAAEMGEVARKELVMVTEEERSMAAGAVADWLVSLWSGDWEDFVRVRCGGTSGRVNREVLESYLADMKLTTPGGIETNWSDALRLLRQYWESDAAKMHRGIVTGVCLEEAEWVFERYSRVPSDADVLMGRAGEYKFRPTMLLRPGMECAPSADEVLRRWGALKVATWCGLVRFRTGDAWPLFAQWYYDPEQRRWLPWRMGDCGPRSQSVTVVPLF